MELDAKERDEIIANIINELLLDVSNAGWKKYLYKEVVKFNVKCCHKALCDIVDLFYMPIDSGDNYIDKKSLWKNDVAASISEKDCSQGRCDKQYKDF